MKRLVVYYSLSGNTEEAAKQIAGKLGAELLKLETVKPMPKRYAAQLLVGGGQVAFGHVPALKPLGKELGAYDEIILGSPIWNSKGVPAINAFLQDEAAAAKVTAPDFPSLNPPKPAAPKAAAPKKPLESKPVEVKPTAKPAEVKPVEAKKEPVKAK